MACLAAHPAQAATATDLPNAVCYEPAQLEVIAQGFRDLDVCRQTLVLREQFIEQAKLAPPPENAWWADPSFVVGGVVVSASVGLALGILVGQGRLP